MVLLVALLSGCQLLGLVAVERQPPTRVAEIAFELGGSVDLLRIKLTPPYQALFDPDDVRYGDDLQLVAAEQTTPPLEVISSGWADRESYVFRLRHGFVGRVRVTNARGRSVLDLDYAKIDPRYLGSRGYEYLLIDSSSGSATSSTPVVRV